VPREFSHTVVVPGLVDMARPAFQEVGQKSPLRQAFWYRRTFKLPGATPEVALLKIHKARYGTKVWVNGREAGEHLPCFTPAWFKVTHLLHGNGAENELVIRVGADRSMLPDGMPKGFDFEKLLYLPGIYDSVELILSGAPRIVNVQVVPDIERQQVRVVAEIEAGGQDCDVGVSAEVVEARSKNAVGRATAQPARLGAGRQTQVDLTVPVANCRVWSPEDPFLYELHLNTGADAVTVRFGMRSFRFDPATKRALLNGRPYYLRGSNVTLYRFFEDADRGDLPWRASWVRQLHHKFKTLHWNSLRYCIGFPPESWYDIADEEGFLIQDEFPIWVLGGKPIGNSEPPDPVVAEKLVPEYTEWLRERWNHPCVVIWDAQNESYTDETGKAIQAVRNLDLSNRPWENGWGEPQAPTDCVESHPYQFMRDWTGRNKNPFRMREMATLSGKPRLQPAHQKRDVPILINEYAWLWLNRKGEPTSVCQEVYRNLLGPESTVAQRRELWAKYLAAKTEFWRAHRQCAGVLHFCSLGYNRRGDLPQPEGGATCDHWLDVQNLTWQPYFEEYVRDAFAPVGVTLNFWEEQVSPGEKLSLQVYVINDLEPEWQGTVWLRVLRGAKPVSAWSKDCTLGSFGREILSFSVALPSEPGDYTLVAELAGQSGGPVRSIRDFRLAPKQKEEKGSGNRSDPAQPAAANSTTPPSEKAKPRQ
jgi:hypothetical protein